MSPDVFCPDCFALGKIKDKEGTIITCPNCGGKGKVWEDDDFEYGFG